MERALTRPVLLSGGSIVAATSNKQYYAVEVVRQIEETVEIMVEAPDENAAHDAALEHLMAHSAEYEWLNPKRDLIVWRKRQIDPPAIVDVSALPARR